MGKNVAEYKNFEAPKTEGIHYRLLCLNGRGKGVSYFLTGKRIIIGRSETADIQVFDIKSSREHAEITIIGNEIIVTDLGSQNGIVVNDLKVKQHKLKDGDKLFIGQTVFKFGRIKVAGNEKNTQKKADDAQEVEESKPKKKNPLILFIVVGAVLYFILGGDDSKKVDEERGRSKNIFEVKTVSDDFTNLLERKKTDLDKETSEKLKIIFQQGLREYSSGNYFRAMNEFQKALITRPDDAQANFYLRKAKDALDDLIAQHLEKGDKDFGSLKYQSAQVEYCSVIRILRNYQENEKYKQAKDKIKEIETKMGMEQGEIKCLD